MRTHGRRVFGAVAMFAGIAVAGGILAPAASAASRAERATPAKRADFNGDGFADLAVGAPNFGGGVGGVTIGFGSPHGITANGMDTLSPQTGGPNQAFGTSLASADFNRDGFADLAVGIPGKTVHGQASAGQVAVLFGSDLGVRSDNPRLFTENTPGIPGTPDAFEFFGATLAAGDFDRDGRPDLAVGVPFEEVDGQAGAGSVIVLHGTPGGPAGAGAALFTLDTPGIRGDPHPSAGFGFSVASGNLGKGPGADLAIGASSDHAGSPQPSGSVTVMFGGPDGLHGSGSQRWTATSAGQSGGSKPNQGFGWSVAIGNLGRSADNDLVIGSVGASVGGATAAGAVFVLYGTTNGPTSQGADRLTQATPGVPTGPEQSALFGNALGIQDFDGDDRADLAVSAPGQSSQPGADDDAGAVFFFPGGPNGVRPGRSGVLTGVDLTGQSVDTDLRAGAALSTGQFGRGTTADLVIGIPNLTAGGNDFAGGVAVVFGGTGGPSPHFQVVDGDTFTEFPHDPGTEAGQALVASPRPSD